MIKPILIISLVLTLSACVELAPKYNRENIPWQYPQLSTTGCPDISGGYDISDIPAIAYTALSDKEFSIWDQESYFIPLSMNIVTASDHINIKYFNTTRETLAITTIDGINFGCAEGKLVKRKFEEEFRGGETAGHFVKYTENVITKLTNGDLEVVITKHSLSGSFLMNESVPPEIKRYVIKKTKP